MKKLTYAKVERMLLDYDMGERGKVLADRYGITHSAVSWWAKHYGGLDAKWLKRVRELERDVLLLKQRRDELERLLDASKGLICQLRPSVVTRGAMSPLVRAAFGLTRSGANRVLGLCKSAGESKKLIAQDNVLIEMMAAYFRENPGQGFKIAFDAILRNEPYTRGRIYRIYQDAGFTLSRRKERIALPARVAKAMPVVGQPNVTWSMDFMIDVLPSGKRFRLLNIIDDFHRECVVSRVMERNTAKAVVATLEECSTEGRKPQCIRTDNGGEFKSVTYCSWADKHKIKRAYIRPRVSNDNSYVERFNGIVRAEVLDRYTFRSLGEVQRMLDDWRIRYNISRPHSALGGLSPVQYDEIARKSKDPSRYGHPHLNGPQSSGKPAQPRRAQQR